MDIDDLEVRMKFYGNRSKPRNVKEVKIFCAKCGKESWQTYQRVRKYLAEGTNSFCSRKCASLYWTSQLKPTRLGKENAGFTWDKQAGVWNAYWDDETGRMRTTTKARWLWEMYRGEVPDGYWVTFIDGDKSNCELNNLKLISRGERMSAAMMGHQLSDETKEKISEAHRGKVISDAQKENMSIALQRRWAEGQFDNVHVGEHHRLWRGGNTGEYPNEFYRMRKKVLRRDGSKCRICGNREKIHVHHIDRDKKNNDKTNLISVCASCHAKIHDPATKTDDPQILAFRSMLDSNMKF